VTLEALAHHRGAHYLLIKRNQPGLHAQLAALPWRDVPVAYTKRERGHGRTERRTLKITSVARGLAFPGAAQAIRIVRRRKVKGKWSAETCYAVTSLTATQASPARLAAIIRGHWGSWATLAGPRGRAALGEVIKVADNVRYGVATRPSIRFPVQLTGNESCRLDHPATGLSLGSARFHRLPRFTRAAPAPADRGHGGPHPGGSAADRPPTRLAGAQKRSPDASTICRPLAHQAGADHLMVSCAVMRRGIGSRQRAGRSCGALISMWASPAKAPTPGKPATQPIPRRAAGVSGRPSPPLYD
jgi:hypothetical protein